MADLELRTLDDVDVGLRDGFSEVVVVVVGGGAVPLGGTGLCLVLAFDVGGEVAAVAAMACLPLLPANRALDPPPFSDEI